MLLRKQEIDGIHKLDKTGTAIIEIYSKDISKEEQEKEEVKCFNGHKMDFRNLAPYTAVMWVGGVACDKCQEVIKAENGFYHCMICQFDLCLECSGHNKSSIL